MGQQKFPWIGKAVYMQATWGTYRDFWPFMTASQHRLLRRLKSGWLGMLPGDARIGDAVILARGGWVPAIVREEEEKRKVFVGEAYIHGIMDGGIRDENKCKEIEFH